MSADAELLRAALIRSEAELRLMRATAQRNRRDIEQAWSVATRLARIETDYLRLRDELEAVRHLAGL